MDKKIKKYIEDALALHKIGNYEEAEKIYKQVLASSPENTDALNLLGLIKIQTEDFEQAISYLCKAVEIKPCAYFYENLASAFIRKRDFANALKCYENALDYEPESFDIWFNLGYAHKLNNQLEEAIVAYNKAIELNPKSADAYFNLANIYERLNNTNMALKNYEMAAENKIDYAGINYFLGVCNLKLKNFEAGWKFYEGRPSRDFAILSQQLVYKDLIIEKPLWQGEDISDKTLFVYYDSALGDTIMYARYLPILGNLCKKLIFKPQHCFVDLFKENNFGAEIIDSATLPQDINFDTHIPIMSIPFVLGLNKEEDIPLAQGYIKANSGKTLEYKSKYFDTNKLKIGIKWMGNPTYDVERIIPIEKFFGLFELKNAQFYSLQKGDGIEELQKIPSKYNIVDLGETFFSFTDTAAAIENLDLVISNDTSVAHLAGALGKPCWVLLPFVQNWRWHNDLSYSPWYKSIKLFKQSTPNSWDEVFEQVQRECERVLSEKFMN